MTGSDQPRRVQLQRTKGWRMPPETVKVDRSTRWGNPYYVEKQGGQRWNPASNQWEDMWELRHPRWVKGDIFPTKESATNMAVMRFAGEVAPLMDLAPLRGKSLACWCKPGQPCHADVLLDLANAADSRTIPGQPHAGLSKAK